MASARSSLAAKCVDRLGADHRIGASQVDQVVDVDHQRMQIEAFARGLRSDLDFGLAGHGGAPHARAGGKDLEGVRAQIRGLESRSFKRARDGCVDA